MHQALQRLRRYLPARRTMDGSSLSPFRSTLRRSVRTTCATPPTMRRLRQGMSAMRGDLSQNGLGVSAARIRRKFAVNDSQVIPGSHGSSLKWGDILNEDHLVRSLP